MVLLVGGDPPGCEPGLGFPILRPDLLAPQQEGSKVPKVVGHPLWQGHLGEVGTGLGGPVGCPCLMEEETLLVGVWGWK